MTRRKRRRGKYGSRKTGKHRSKFEGRVSKNLPAKIRKTYESTKLSYIIPERAASYTPDWVISDRRGEYTKSGEPKLVAIEAGILTLAKRKKLLLIKAMYGSQVDIKILLIHDKAPGIKSASKWCEKKGFDYEISSEGIVPERWLK